MNFATPTISQKEGNKDIKNYFKSDLLSEFVKNGFYKEVEDDSDYDTEIKGNIYYSVQDNYQENKKRIKIANKKTKAGNWIPAVKIWKSEENSGNIPQLADKIAALYNLVIFYEGHDHLEDAINKFQKLNKLTNSSKYDKDISRNRNRKIEEQKLKKMQGRN